MILKVICPKEKKQMKLFKISLFSVFFVFSILIFLSSLKYRNWKEEMFEKEKLVCLQNIDINQEEIDKKVEKFVLSDSQTEFIVFNADEIIHILQKSIRREGNILLKDLCVFPSKGEWMILIKYETKRVPVPWLVLNIVKDNRETPEIYVKDLTIGNTKFPFNLSKGVVKDINKGISEAITLLNENQFLGREIKNIELTEERIVIR